MIPKALNNSMSTGHKNTDSGRIWQQGVKRQTFKSLELINCSFHLVTSVRHSSVISWYSLGPGEIFFLFRIRLSGKQLRQCLLYSKTKLTKEIFQNVQKIDSIDMCMRSKIELFATKLTGSRISADFITPSYGLFLTCRGEKYIQYCTIIYSIQYLHVGFSNVKTPLQWVVAFSASVRTSVHSCPNGKQLPCFPQGIGPTPSPDPTSSIPHAPLV
jgi:hypothetical protein